MIEQLKLENKQLKENQSHYLTGVQLPQIILLREILQLFSKGQQLIKQKPSHLKNGNY